MSLLARRTLGQLSSTGSSANPILFQIYARVIVRFVTYSTTGVPTPPVKAIANTTGIPIPPVKNIAKDGFNDGLQTYGGQDGDDWSRSFSGLSSEAFPKEIADVLMAPIDPEDVEIKPDGLLYLPEIKYRRILNKTFGPGGWGLAPRGETTITEKLVTREYGLVCHGRLVSIARGEMDYFDPSAIPMATEGAKSNALTRACKDLGIASELWDPRFVRNFKKQYADEKFCENVSTKKKKKIWRRKGDPIEYPWKISVFGS